MKKRPERMREPLIQALKWSSGRFVAALTFSIIIYLATITLASLLLADEIAQRWHEYAVGLMTVQLPLFDNADLRVQRANAALATIQRVPDVAYVELFFEDQLLAKVLPWLDSVALPAARSLSTVLEVQLKGSARDKAPAGGDRLRAELDDAEIKPGCAFLEQALRVIQTVRYLAIVVLCGLVAAFCASILLATLAGLEASAEAVQLVHLLGADDATIIKVIMFAALRTVLIGASIGSALGVVTLFAFAQNAVMPDFELATIFSLSPAGWAVTFLLPPAIALVAATFATWFAARRTLAMMP